MDRYFGPRQNIMIKGKIFLDLAQYFESKYPLDIIQPLALNDAMDRRFIACQIFPLFIGNLVQKHISDRDTKMLHMKELAGRCNLCVRCDKLSITVSQIVKDFDNYDERVDDEYLQEVFFTVARCCC